MTTQEVKLPVRVVMDIFEQRLIVLGAAQKLYVVGVVSPEGPTQVGILEVTVSMERGFAAERYVDREDEPFGVLTPGPEEVKIKVIRDGLGGYTVKITSPSLVGELFWWRNPPDDPPKWKVQPHGADRHCSDWLYVFRRLMTEGAPAGTFLPEAGDSCPEAAADGAS